MGFLVVLCILAYLIVGFSIGVILIRTGSIFCQSSTDLLAVTTFWSIGLPILVVSGFFTWIYDKIEDYPR